MGAGLAGHRHLSAAAIFAAVTLSRLPFATTHLWAWDSVLYARALEHGFLVSADPALSRPHPPGYIWYVGVAALARSIVLDSNAALVAVSILASAAGAALLFLVASRYVRPGIALVVALAYAVSPLTWAYSEIAYPYTVLALISVGLGGLFLARGSAAGASLAFGLLAGARQDILILLAPLWLWSVRPRTPRQALRAVALVGLGAAAWIAPSIVLSGGPAEYAAAVLQQSALVANTYSVPTNGLPALTYNAGFTLEAIAWGLGLFALPLAIALARAGVGWRRDRRPSPGSLDVALAAWAVPAVAFYTVVHIGEWGYVLSVLPALLLASGIAVDRAMPRELTHTWRVAAAASVVLPAAVFLLGDGVYSAVVGDARFSAAMLARHDERLGADVAYVRRTFSPATTAILTREDHLLVRYYLPEYAAWYWDPDPYRPMAKRHRTMRPMNVVVLTPGLQPALQGDARSVEIAPGITLSYLPLDAGHVLELRGERYVVREPPGR